MAYVVVFPDQTSFELGQERLASSPMFVKTLETPSFCDGLAAPAVLVTGTEALPVDDLTSMGVSVSGILQYSPFKKQIPQADSPDPVWREAVGDLRATYIGPSISDPVRLRVDVKPGKDLGALIPLIARLIRGGSYRFHPPSLAFEEEHRLLVISPELIVFSRIDDLLDFWIILRSMIDLIVAAWERRSVLKPDKEPRQGVGAIEIFKRLPGTNCGECANASCMEFAMCLFMGRGRIDQCPVIAESKWARNLESLKWIMSIIALPEPAPDCSTRTLLEIE
jgi:ArsR family metal-binding transcriptional regulator